MAGKGGGAWKVAYADFVTAMMAFFLVMWITAQSKQVKVAVAHYFNDPFNALSKSKGPQPAGSTTTGPLAPGSVTIMPSRIPGDAPGVVKRHTAGSRPHTRKGDRTAEPTGGTHKNADGEKAMVFVLHSGERQSEGLVVVFVEDSVDLSPQASRQLKSVAPSLVGKRNKIEIRGHATNRNLSPDSPYRDAWQLSYARCLTTMRILQEEGVEPERIRLSQAGAYEPHTIREDPSNQARNSCVDVYMLSEFVDDSVGSREEREGRFEGR